MTTPRNRGPTSPNDALRIIMERLERQEEARRPSAGLSGGPAGQETSAGLVAKTLRDFVQEMRDANFEARAERRRERADFLGVTNAFLSGLPGARPSQRADDQRQVRTGSRLADEFASRLDSDLGRILNQRRREAATAWSAMQGGDLFRMPAGGGGGASGRPGSMQGVMRQAGMFAPPRLGVSPTEGIRPVAPRRPEDFSQLQIDRLTMQASQQARQSSAFMVEYHRLLDRQEKLAPSVGLIDLAQGEKYERAIAELKHVEDTTGGLVDVFERMVSIPENPQILSIAPGRKLPGGTIAGGFEGMGHIGDPVWPPGRALPLTATVTESAGEGRKETEKLRKITEPSLVMVTDMTQALEDMGIASGVTAHRISEEIKEHQQNAKTLEGMEKARKRLNAEEQDTQKLLRAERGLQSAARDREIQEQRRDPRLVSFEAQHTRRLRRFDSDIMPPWSGTVPSDTGFGGFDWRMRPRRHYTDVPILEGDRTARRDVMGAGGRLFRRAGFGMSINDTRLAGTQFDRIQGSGFGRHAGQIDLDELNMIFPRLDAASHAAAQFSETTVKKIRDIDRTMAGLETEKPTETRTQADIDQGKENLAKERERMIQARHDEQQALDKTRDTQRSRLSDLQSGVQLQEQNNRKLAKASAEIEKRWAGIKKIGLTFAGIVGGIVASAAAMGKQWANMALSMRNAAASSELMASEMLHMTTAFQEVTGIQMAAGELERFERAQRSVVGALQFGIRPSREQILAYGELGQAIGETNEFGREQYMRLQQMDLARREWVAGITQVPPAIMTAIAAGYDWNEVMAQGIHQTEDQIKANAESALKWTRLTNDIKEFAGEIGGPALIAVMKFKAAVMPMVATIANWVTANPKLAAGLFMAGAALAAIIPALTMVSTLIVTARAALQGAPWPVTVGLVAGAVGLTMVTGGIAAKLGSDLAKGFDEMQKIGDNIKEPVKEGVLEADREKEMKDKNLAKGEWANMTPAVRAAITRGQFMEDNILRDLKQRGVPSPHQYASPLADGGMPPLWSRDPDFGKYKTLDEVPGYWDRVAGGKPQAPEMTTAELREKWAQNPEEFYRWHQQYDWERRPQMPMPTESTPTPAELLERYRPDPGGTPSPDDMYYGGRGPQTVNQTTVNVYGAEDPHMVADTVLAAQDQYQEANR